MKDFKLDENGDVVVSNDINIIEGNEALCQQIRMILGTYLGEWFLNKNEGINYREILIKNPSDDFIRTEIQRGLLQVDDTLWITEYDQKIETRTIKIIFTAQNEKGDTVTIKQSF